MSLVKISTIVSISVVLMYWYINRHKPLQHIFKKLRNNVGMQGVGILGLIDDYVNKARNQTVLPDASGRIAVITGGSRGIGAEVIRGLLKANMIVIMGIRKPTFAKKMAEQFENGENLHAFELNLLSLKSVREFADVIAKKFPQIHILINNAGVMYSDYKLTEDGFESLLAVNHLGHFYLTHLLLPALKRGGKEGENSRIVNVTSCAHYPGKISFEDINSKNYYDTSAAYSQSKLAMLMSARYINKLLEEEGYRVRCYAVHPGVVDTALLNSSLWKKVLPWAVKRVFKEPTKGAIPILHTCFDKDLEDKGGLYISNCIEGISNKLSKSAENQRKVFDLSCHLVKINESEFGKLRTSSINKLA